VGLGSPHGDDRIGWVVVQELATAMPGKVDARTGRHPAELLDWLYGVDDLVVCDACRSGGRTGQLHRWCWPTDSLAIPERSGSHDLTLPFALALAGRLGRLPERVTVWGVELGDASPNGPLSGAVQNAVPWIVQTIADDLRAGRSRREPRRHA